MNFIIATRAKIVGVYKHYETVFNFCFRLLAGAFIFSLINSLRFYHSVFAVLFSPPLDFPYLALSAVLFAVLPPTLANLLIAVEACIQISRSVEVAVFAFLLFVAIILFYARLQPKKSFLIIGIIVAFYFKLPYFAVLVAGLYLGASSVVPIVIAVAVNKFAPVFVSLAKSLETPSMADLTSIPARVTEAYTETFNSVSSQAAGSWIFMSIAFAAAALCVFAISRLSVNYSKDIAVGCGTIVLIICSFIGGAFPPAAFVFIIISALLTELVRFFDIALDYKRAENVEFEDNDNYYYVKIIPKL